MTTCAPGSARFRRRAHDAASLGERELVASAATVNRLNLQPRPPRAALEQQERALTLQLDGLRDHAYLAQELESSLQPLPGLSDLLSSVRERRQLLLLQQTIVLQALTAVRLVKR